MAYLDSFIRKTKRIELGGKNFVFTELTLKDFGMFRAWLQERQKKANAERRRELIEEAQKIGNIEPLKLLEHLDKPLSEEQVEAEMDTVEGMGYLAWLSLRYKHNDIEQGEVMEMLTIEKIPAIADVIAGGITEDKKKRPRQPIKKK